MKTKILNRTLQAFLSLMVAVALFIGCTKDEDPDSSNPQETLSTQEIDGMKYMVENEKLLRDYFTAMNDKFDVPLFNQLAENEQSHLDLLSVKFDIYDLENPANALGAGEFVNPELHLCYDDLIANGGASIYAGLIAGIAKVEEDLLDIPLLIDQLEGNQDIEQVYSKILDESQSNLETLKAEMKKRIVLSVQPEAPNADF